MFGSGRSYRAFIHQHRLLLHVDVEKIFAVEENQLPLNELLAQYDLGALHRDQFLVVVVDDGLFQLLLLLLRHSNWVRRRGVGLVVQRAELVGSHVSNGSTGAAL